MNKFNSKTGYSSLVISTLLTMIMLLVMYSPGVLAATPTVIPVYITDFGINQQRDSSGAITNRYLENDSGTLLIDIRMPAGPINESALRRSIARRLESELAQPPIGTERIEIQLIQRIGTIGYFDSGVQNRVDEFGRAAYGALAESFTDFRRRGLPYRVHAVVGSNGGKMLARSAPQLVTADANSFLDGVDLINSRGMYQDTANLIETVGPHKVRVFVTQDDFPAPDFPGRRSTAHLDVAMELSDTFPTMQTYFLNPVHEASSREVHILPMINPQARYKVSQHLASGWLIELPGVRDGNDLRRNLRRKVPADTASGSRWHSNMDGLSVLNGGQPTSRYRYRIPRELVQNLSHFGRRITQQPIESGVVRMTGQAETLLDQYTTVQTRRISSGLSPQRISDVYGENLLRSNGFTSRMISELDGSIGDVGGVDMDLEFHYQSEELGETRDRILNFSR